MNNKELIRINKFLSEIGYCSRRQADKLIEQGKVKPLFEDEIYKQLDFSHLEPCQEYIPDFLANKPRPTNRWAGQIYGDIKNND